MHSNQDEEQLIIFRVGPVVCSVVSRLVESIVDNQPLHRFPGQANFILGVLHYRDHAVSIVNLFNKFDFPEPKVGPESCFIMGNTIYGTVGFWVDEVLEVTTQYKLHQTNLPTYAGANVFDCALLWSDQIVLQTDLNCLFTMNESAPLQDWVSKDENNRILNHQNSHVETSGQAAWRKAANEASEQEIQSLMSRGAQLSKILEPTTEQLLESEEDTPSAWSGEEEAITVSPLTEISETVVVDSDVGVDSSGQLKFVFQSHEHRNSKRELGVNTKTKAKVIEESSELKNTLDAIAEQHGDVDSIKFEGNNFEVAKNSFPSKKEFVKPVALESKGGENRLISSDNASSLTFEKNASESGSSFLDETRVVTNVAMKEYEVEQLNSGLNVGSKDSDVYDHIQDDWDTLLFTEVALDEKPGRAKHDSEEFSVLADDDSVAMYDDTTNNQDDAFHKRNDAVERVAKRIMKKNENRHTPSPFRISASILVVAVTVFIIQSQWLNSDAEEIFDNVPSLQLLNEQNVQNTSLKEVSIETVIDKYGDEYSLRNEI